MSKRFGWDVYSPTKIEGYSTEAYTTEQAAEGIGRFQTQDPANYVLCADTVVEILRGVENPNCSLAEFYAQSCGVCTSLDYPTCVAQ